LWRPDDQIIAGIGYLLCALGTPCIYYGTEQGFSGNGNDDAFIREAMFDLDDPQKNFMNQDCRIYKEISKIAKEFSDLPPIRFGRMYFREISGNGNDFGLPQGNPWPFRASWPVKRFWLHITPLRRTDGGIL
jgi:alpha-amylase